MCVFHTVAEIKPVQSFCLSHLDHGFGLSFFEQVNLCVRLNELVHGTSEKVSLHCSFMPGVAKFFGIESYLKSSK